MTFRAFEQSLRSLFHRIGIVNKFFFLKRLRGIPFTSSHGHTDTSQVVALTFLVMPNQEPISMPCLQFQGVWSWARSPDVPEGEDENVAQSRNQHSLLCDGDLPETADGYQMVNDVIPKKWFE